MRTGKMFKLAGVLLFSSLAAKPVSADEPPTGDQMAICRSQTPVIDSLNENEGMSPSVRKGLLRCPAAIPFVDDNGLFDYGRARLALGRVAASELRLTRERIFSDEVSRA